MFLFCTRFDLLNVSVMFKNIIPVIFLVFGVLASAADISSGPTVYKTLIVETVHPFSVTSYSPPLVSKSVTKGGGDSLEGVFFEFVSSMKSADYDWNNSLWDLQSLAEMKKRDAEAGRGQKFWESKWKSQISAIYTLLNKIEYGKYSIIEFEVDIDGRKSKDTLVFEKIANRWRATQALSSSPVLAHWNTSRGRVQVAPEVLFAK